MFPRKKKSSYAQKGLYISWTIGWVEPCSYVLELNQYSQMNDNLLPENHSSKSVKPNLAENHGMNSF